MSTEIEALTPTPQPAMVIYDETYETELEIRKRIEESLTTLAFSTVGVTSREIKDRLAVAIQSRVFLMAENISRRAQTDLASTVLLRKEHFNKAIEHITELFSHSPADILHFLTAWEESVALFLGLQLRDNSKREAVFNTCEQFRIDLIDFKRVFPKLPA